MGVKKRTYKEAKSLLAIISRWRENGELTTLERDMALSKLSSIYEAILLSSEEEVEEIDEVDEVDEVVDDLNEIDEADELEPLKRLIEEVIEEQEDDEDDIDNDAERDIEVEVILFEEQDEPQEEPQEEEQLKPRQLAQQHENQDPDNKQDEEEPILEHKPHSARRSAILSLYNDQEEEPLEPSQEVAEQTPATPQKIQEQEQLEPQQQVQPLEQEQESIVNTPEEQSDKEDLPIDIQIIAERLSNISAPQGVVADKVSSLAKGISLNDRYEMARELFEGDLEALLALMNHLDTFSSFDECVIYISENHSFSSDNNAAQMLLELLKRRFN